jgi:hypothetical protein
MGVGLRCFGVVIVGVHPNLGVDAAAGDGVAAVAVGGLGRHFCLSFGGEVLLGL